MLSHQPVALALSLAFLGAPTAAAKSEHNLTRTTPAAPTIVRVLPPDDGFDWRDGAIGAAGGFALSMIGLGGALVGSARRQRRTCHIHNQQHGFF